MGETSTTLAVEKQYPPALPSRPLRPLEPHAALKTQLEGARRVPTMFGAQTVEAQLCKHIGAAYFIFDVSVHPLRKRLAVDDALRRT